MPINNLFLSSRCSVFFRSRRPIHSRHGTQHRQPKSVEAPLLLQDVQIHHLEETAHGVPRSETHQGAAFPMHHLYEDFHSQVHSQKAFVESQTGYLNSGK